MNGFFLLMLLKEIQEFDNLTFLAKKAMEGFISGLHSSPLRGFSVEFAEHRAYNPGESVKNLDWKLLARTEKKYIKQFIEETNLKCHLWVDVSESMQYPENWNKQKLAVLTASSIMYLLQNQRDAFSLTLFNDNNFSYQSDIKSTRAHLYQNIELLNNFWVKTPVYGGENQPLNWTAKCSGIKRRSMVVVISDFLWENENAESEFWQALSYLHFLKCEILLLNTFDLDTELDFNFGDLPVNFIDLENNNKIKLTPEEIKNSYMNQEKVRLEKLKENCFGLGVNYFDCNVSQPIEKALMEFYRQRLSLR